MHCGFAQPRDDQSVFGLGASRDAFLAAILANAKPVCMSKLNAGGNKRSCPFAGPLRKRRRSDDDLKKLQQDVKELEQRLQSARQRRRPSQTQEDEGRRRLQSVLRACRQQAQQQVDASPMGCPIGMQSSGQLEYDAAVDAPVFKQMEKRLQTQYDELDIVFKDAGVDKSSTSLDDAQVVTGEHDPFVRFAMAKVAPFQLDTVSGAVWNSAKKSSVLNMSTDVDARGCSESIVYLKRQCLLKNDQSSAQGVNVLLRGVCRRFVEPHRIVLVWEGTGDWPRDHMRRHPSSVPIRERGYCIVQDFHCSKSHAPLSLFQTIICMTPGLSAGIAMDQPEHVKMLSDTVIPSYRKILESREQGLENAILDEMIHQRMRDSASRL